MKFFKPVFGTTLRFLKDQHFFPDWFKQGIHLIGDITNTNGELLKLEDINLKFNTNVNILNYYTVYQSVKKFIANHEQPDKPWIFESPSCPLHFSNVILKSKFIHLLRFWSLTPS